MPAPRPLAHSVVRRALIPSLAALALATSLAGTSPATASPEPMRSIGAASALPASSRLLGMVPAEQQLHVSLFLAPRDPSGLEAAAEAASMPGSSSYRHFSSPASIQSTYGPSAASIAATRAWLASQGLAVSATIGAGTVIPVTGSASRVSAAFHTPLSQVRLADGRVAYANASAPQVPQSLAGAVGGVVGLSTVAEPSSQLTRGSSTPLPATSVRPQPKVAGIRTCAGASSLASGYSAQQIDAANDISLILNGGDLGKGVTVALYELSNFSMGDIASFDSCYGITPATSKVLVDGGVGISKSGDGIYEATADVETVSSTAPRAKILVYVAPPTGSGSIDEYAQIAQSDQAQVVSTSWGICEADLLLQSGANLADVEATLFQEMALEGQSVLAAAGDAGSSACAPDIGATGKNNGLSSNTYAPAVSDPASQPFVTGVGGTAITNLTSVSQTTSNQSGPAHDGTGWTAPFDGLAGRPSGFTGAGNTVGGGGISSLWRMPFWQTGVVQANVSSGGPCGAATGTYCREVPDISALAANSPSTPGYAVYGTAGAFSGRGWLSVGGTSLAAPLWGAIVALADQAHYNPSRALGLLNPSLYLQSSGNFRDVTAGTNDFLSAAGSPTNLSCDYTAPKQACYQATTGFDLATGLGTPMASLLLQGLDGLQVILATTSLPQATQGSSYSVSLSASGGTRPYTWAFTSGSLPPGLSLSASSGQLTGVPTSSGTFALSIRVSDSGGPPSTSQTRTFALVVTP
jgi:subtilase family serine protease